MSSIRELSYLPVRTSKSPAFYTIRGNHAEAPWDSPKWPHLHIFCFVLLGQEQATAGTEPPFLPGSCCQPRSPRPAGKEPAPNKGTKRSQPGLSGPPGRRGERPAPFSSARLREPLTDGGKGDKANFLGWSSPL